MMCPYPKMKLCELPADNFDWSRWRACNIFEKIKGGWYFLNIVSDKQIIRQYAIGYIESSKVLCRPKANCKAVMFLIDNEFSWCHVTDEEFKEIFGNET